MSRFSMRKSYWLCLSTLALLMATSGARAQIPISVDASASSLAPAWCPAPTDESNPAQASLGASVDAPTAPYGCTLEGPFWEWGIDPNSVQYSADNSTWSQAPYDSFSAWIVPNPGGATATLYVIYYIGGYWQFPCAVGVSYDDYTSGCGDSWFGTATTLSNGTSVQLLSLTVISGATQTNVIGATNWAKVLNSNASIAKATTLPDNTDAWAQIQWTGGSAGDSANQRKVIGGFVSKTTVTAQIGITQYSVTIWEIWCNLTIRIGGALSPDDNASNLQAGPNWPDALGGGNTLGPIDCKGAPTLTYAYTIGKVEALGTLAPAGVENVIQRTAWKIRRTVTATSWDNGGHYVGGTWMAGPSVDTVNKQDTSQSGWTDLDPLSGGSTGTIYDLDAPGCSLTLTGNQILHTSEVYANFTQWITVTLDAEQICSDNKKWSYMAQVDGDAGTVDANSLSTDWITIPNTPHYAPRN